MAKATKTFLMSHQSPSSTTCKRVGGRSATNCPSHSYRSLSYAGFACESGTTTMLTAPTPPLSCNGYPRDDSDNGRRYNKTPDYNGGLPPFRTRYRLRVYVPHFAALKRRRALLVLIREQVNVFELATVEHVRVVE